MVSELIEIELAYALPQRQFLKKLTLPKGATILEAIHRSGLLKEYPEIDLLKHKVGIFSCKQSLDYQLNSGERIEIYRDLEMDPNEARKRRQGEQGKNQHQFS